MAYSAARYTDSSPVSPAQDSTVHGDDDHG